MSKRENVDFDDPKQARAAVKVFLSRSNLQCHLVKKACLYTADMDTARLQKRSPPVPSYGRYDLRQKVVSLLSDDIATPMFRSDAFRMWLGLELAAYKRELEGHTVPSAVPSGAEGGSIAAMLFTAMSEEADPMNSFSATEKEYAIGDWCKANFKKNLEGVSLKVSSVSLTSAEILMLYQGIVGVEEIVEEEINAVEGKVDRINYGKGLLIDPNKKAKKRSSEIPFVPELVNVKPSAENLIERMESILSKPKAEQPAVITCLFHGAPGTSKTALGMHIADHLGYPLMKRTFGDIQDKYVGEGEKKLVAVFEEAQATGSILLMDELDSLASSRENAEKDHVKTMTNQLLTCIDNYEGILIGTTNFIKSLDPAALRRFFLKMEFGFLSQEQQQLAMKKFFPRRYRNKVMPDIKLLTTGDFKAVRERSLYEPTVPTFERITEMLKEEVKVKVAATPSLQLLTKRSIGFH